MIYETSLLDISLTTDKVLFENSYWFFSFFFLLLSYKIYWDLFNFLKNDIIIGFYLRALRICSREYLDEFKFLWKYV